VNKTHQHQAGQIQVAKPARSSQWAHFPQKYAKYRGKLGAKFI